MFVESSARLEPQCARSDSMGVDPPLSRSADADARLDSPPSRPRRREHRGACIGTLPHSQGPFPAIAPMRLSLSIVLCPWIVKRTPGRAGYRSLVVGWLREGGLGGPWHWKFQPETSRFICRIQAGKLISISPQPVLVAASRCYLIQMLRSALTCTNGCSCWSRTRRIGLRFFLTMDALFRLS